ncbi:MAG: GntR family transcriptional regulator [[Clostridium] symbiosum]
MLDGKAAIPLYVQLEEQIQEKILSGIYQPGEKLQTEGEMAKTYGVSIITVRKAVGGLIDKGLVERKQGKGTFVSKPKYMRDIKKVQSFSDMCRSMGLEPGGRMIENRLVVPEAEIEENLGQQKGMQAVLISRVRYADYEPVAIESTWFPLRYAFLLDETFDNNSLCLTVSRSARWRSFIPRKKIEICRASARDAALLNMSRGDPLLYIRSVALSGDGQPIYAGRQMINGERFSLQINENTEL